MIVPPWHTHRVPGNYDEYISTLFEYIARYVYTSFGAKIVFKNEQRLDNR